MKMRILLSIAYLTFFLSIFSCGGGGSDNSPASTWTGPLNASGYPAIDGKYSFVTKTVDGTCTDGSNGTTGPFAFNLTITQSANSISLARDAGTTELPGFTVTQSTDLSGTVEKNGHFIANKILTGTLSGVSGQVTVNYNLDGNFAPSTWSGTYEYTVSFISAGSSCKYSTTFSGDKL